jgi:lactate racemase
MRFDLPYDRKTVAVEIDNRNLVGSLLSKVESYRPDKLQQELVGASLDKPIGSPKLGELVKGKKNIVIISSER